MSLTEFLDQYAGWGGLILVGFLSLLEFTKIKINPWSAILTWIGDRIMAGMKKEVTEMKTEISGLKSEVATVRADVGSLRGEHREDEAIAARSRILRFSDEVYQCTRHSKEYFDQILLDISNYKEYCDTHKHFKNDMTILAIERIESVYRECLKNHTFL